MILMAYLTTQKSRHFHFESGKVQITGSAKEAKGNAQQGAR